MCPVATGENCERLFVDISPNPIARIDRWEIRIGCRAETQPLDQLLADVLGMAWIQLLKLRKASDRLPVGLPFRERILNSL